MRHTGDTRRALARRLSVAYASGLLSEDTFVRRVDELLGQTLIDQGRIVGDLNLRGGPRGNRRSVTGEALTRALARLRQRARAPDPGPARALLALDWTGDTAQMTIGRHHSSDVVLTAEGVSRRHAALRFRDGRWILQDLDSTNGTTVNGVLVGRCELRPGDHLDIGGEHLLID